MRLPRAPHSRESGFTLLEVLIAVFVFGTVMSTVVVLATQSMTALASAKDEIQASELGEGMMRRMLDEFESGKLPEVGRTEGAVEIAPPSESELADPSAQPAFQYRLDVEPYTVPLPQGTPRGTDAAALSNLFVSVNPRTGAKPPTLRVVLRIFPDGADPERATPFVMMLAEPAEVSAGSDAAAGTGTEFDNGQLQIPSRGTGAGSLSGGGS